MQNRGVSAYAAEFFGTLLLVFFICAIVSISPGTAQRAAEGALQGAGGGFVGLGVTDWAVIGLVHFLVLAVLILGLGALSGAIFNPALTIAAAAIRKLTWRDAAIYTVLQLAGAVVGALLVYALLKDAGADANYGTPGLSDKIINGSELTGVFLEALGTFFLMWAVMSTALNPRGQKDWAGFAIGGSLGAAVMVIGPLTGAGLNPARWFGPALISGHWDAAWVYILGPIVGALLAAIIYTAIQTRSAFEESLADDVDTVVVEEEVVVEET